MAKVPGPAPAAVKRRRNKDTLAPKKQGERRGVTAQVAPNPDWRQDIRNYFRAVLASGQSDWFENSDVMTLYLQCELLDRVLRGSRTVPVYKEEKTDEGKYIPILDEDGELIPELDEFGEPLRRTIGNINGQALRPILDMSQDLLVTEGARRKLRIDLGLPEDDSEPIEKAIVAKQRESLAAVKV